LEALDSGRWWRVAPQLVDQPVAGDQLVRVKEQNGQERALLDAAERQHVVPLGHLQWAKDPEVHVLYLRVAATVASEHRPEQASRVPH
jgi:hypothetical protein